MASSRYSPGSEPRFLVDIEEHKAHFTEEHSRSHDLSSSARSSSDPWSANKRMIRTIDDVPSGGTCVGSQFSDDSDLSSSRIPSTWSSIESRTWPIDDIASTTYSRSHDTDSVVLSSSDTSNSSGKVNNTTRPIGYVAGSTHSSSDTPGGSVWPFLHTSNSWSVYNMRSLNDAITGGPNRLEVNADESFPAASSGRVFFPHAIERVFCRHCDRVFSGTWANHNYNRHIESKHRPGTTSSYMCTECSKSFKRSDTLLKHKRAQHGLAPAIRRKKSQLETYSPPPANEQPQYEHNIEVEEIPRTVSPYVVQNSPQDPATDKERIFVLQNSPKEYQPQHITPDSPPTLQDLVDSLEPKIRGHFCSTFFSHWADILEELRYRGSEIQLPFSQVLANAKSQLRVYDSHYVATTSGRRDAASTERLPASSEWNGERNSLAISTENSFRTRPNQGYQSIESVSTVTLEGMGISTASTHLRRKGRSERNSNTNNGPSVEVADKNTKMCLKKLDCPVHKHLLMLNCRSRCGAGNFTHLSQVRHHLQPGRVRAHSGFPRFLRYCRTCKDYFVDGNQWTNHQLGACVNNIRHRSEENKIESWARLYVALYPEATLVPSPFTGEKMWLSLDVADLVPFHLQSHTPNSPIVNADLMSFLDLEQSSTHISETGPEVQNVQQLDYQAAYAIVLRNAVAHVSRILEEGEVGLHPDHLEQTITELGEEFRLQIGRRHPSQQPPGQSITSTAPLNLQESSTPAYNSNINVTPDTFVCRSFDDSPEGDSRSFETHPLVAQSHHEGFSQSFLPSTHSNSDDTLPGSSYETDPSSVDGIDCRPSVHAYAQHKSHLQDCSYDVFPFLRAGPTRNNTSRLYFPHFDDGEIFSNGE